MTTSSTRSGCSPPTKPRAARKLATYLRNCFVLRHRRVVLIWSLVIGHGVPFPVRAQVNVLTYHNGNFRSGLNPNETLLTPANVNTNSFGKLFVYTVDGFIYAQPLYVSGLNIPGQG